MSSGGRKVYRLSLRGNRRLNHAIHMAAITQIRHKHSEGRAYYERKIAEGKTHKEALRCLKRRISDAIYARLRADARQAAAAAPQGAREGNRGTTLTPARPAHTPHAGSSDKPLPGLRPAYEPRGPDGGQAAVPGRRRRKPAEPLDNDDNKEDSICASGLGCGHESLPALRSPGSCRGFAARASGPGLRRQARRVGRGSARGGWQVNSPFGRLMTCYTPDRRRMTIPAIDHETPPEAARSGARRARLAVLKIAVRTGLSAVCNGLIRTWDTAGKLLLFH